MSACWPLRMPPPAKAVLISLADMANDDGYCWPSIERLCERTCFGRTAVIDAIYWLETHAVLKAHRNNGRKTTYTVTPDTFSEEESVVVAKRATRMPARALSEAVDKPKNQSATRTGPPDEPVRHADGTSPPDGLNQSATRTLTVITVKEPSIPPVGPPRGAPAFDDLLAIWPVSRRGKRARAERLLADLIGAGAVTMEQLVDAAQAQAQQPQWRRDEGRYVPLLCNWLKDRRWLDGAVGMGVGDAWQESRAGVDARARRLGMLPWDEAAFREGRPGSLSYPVFRQQVIERDRRASSASSGAAA